MGVLNFALLHDQSIFLFEESFMIIQDETKRIFTLQTCNTTYQMKADQNGLLLHTYYGPKIREGDLSRLIRYADRGFSPNPNEAGNDRT